MANNTRDESIKFQFDAKQTGIDEVGKSLDDVGRKSEEAGNLFEFFKKHLEEIIATATAVEVALKGIEFGKESLKNAEDVEQSLSRVRALAGNAAQAFGEMDEAVQKAAQAVNIEPQAAAAGLAALASQGLTAKGSIDALVPTLQLAKIANIDAGQAAQEVGSALKAFNLPASDAQKIVDELTAASHGAAGGLGAMSAAAVALSPDAKTLGLTFDDVVGTLGLLSSRGLDTEKSVRGLRTIFQELQNPTSALRVELLSLGDGTNDFGKAVAALTSGTPRANEALLHLSGGARTVIEALGQAGPDAIAKFTASLERQNGVAAEAVRIIDENLKGASTRLGLAIKHIGEELAKPVLEPFKDELNKLADELNKFADSPDFKDIEKEVGEMAKNAATALDKFLHGLDWKKFLAEGKDAIGGIGKSLKDLADTASSVATGINKTFAGIGAAYHLAATGLDLVVAGAAKAADGIVTVSEKAAALHTGAKEAAEGTDKLHIALQSLGDNAIEQAAQNTKKLGENVDTLADSQGRATAATATHGAAAAAATPSIQAQADASAKAAKSTDQLVQALGFVPDYLSETGDAAAAAAHSLGTLGFQALRIGGGPLQDAKRAAAEAAQAFADLQKAGNATPAALEAARQAVINTARELVKLQMTTEASAEAVKTAFSTLRIASQTELQDLADKAEVAFNTIKNASDGSAAAIADTQNAFLAYAQRRLAASAQLDAGTRQSIEADLEAKAAVLDVSGALRGLEAQSAKSQSALVSDANRGATAFDAEADAVGRLNNKLAGGGGGGGGGSVSGSAKQADDALKGAGRSAKDLKDQIANIGTGGFPDLVQAEANARAGFLSISEAAAKAFDANLVSEWGLAFDSTGAGFGRFADALNKAASDTQRQINDQRKMLDSWIGELESGTAQSVQELQGLADEVKSGVVPALNLLGQQDLSRLLAALDAAKAKAEAAEQAAKAAKDSFDSLAESALDDLLQEEGNNNALEERRHRKKLKDLQEAADKAGELNSKEYLEAVANENRLHKLKMDHIKEQQDAQNNKDGKSANGGAAGLGQPVNGGGGTSGNAIGGGAAASATVNTPNRTYNLLFADNASAVDWHDLINEIAAAKGNSI